MADNNSNAALQAILPHIQNPNNGLTDNKAKILQSLIDKATKAHAQDFIDQVGPDLAQQVVNHQLVTSPTNQDSSSSNSNDSSNNSSSNASQVLDPLIAMARKGQTSVPSTVVDNPAGPANVKTGSVELDKPANWFEQNFGNAQTPYQDANGVIHAKLGGRFNQRNDIPTLQKMGLIQTITGKETPSPKDSIAYQVEQQIQQAEKVPMTQEQKKNYELNVQAKAADLSKGIAGQTMTAITPLTDNLQKIDSLMPLFDNALSKDTVTSKTAISQLAPLLRDLAGDKTNGNILNQSLFEKMLTGLSGRVGGDLVTKAKANVQALRSSLINRVGNIQNNSASRIGSFKIGDQVVNGSQLLNHAYFNEAGRAVNTFNSEADAKKAGLQDGTPITVNGKPAFWRN